MNDIERQFEAYSAWRTGLFESISQFRGWLRSQEIADTQVDQRLEQVLSTLRDDKLYVAFVAEFSRGKSELINAIFFAGFGQRVLPSSAGRTTMCPTELVYEHNTDPFIRLLPIETRTSGTTVSELKAFPDEWTTIPLDTGSPDKVAEALQHIAQIKSVSRDIAQSMGLHIAEEETDNGMHVTADGLVEIPQWRHAIINFPHPLLEQGLVILDTPGLNALGTEPELTLSLLPSAHAVLFILAADTGVTKSDIQVWHNFISNPNSGAAKGRMVVLNKIDGLWDELRDWEEVQREIDRQIQETARHLGIGEHNIYPVSAQKALLGKIRGDRTVLERSRIGALEKALGEELLPAKRDIVRANIGGDMMDIIKAVRTILAQRLKGVQEHMEELEGLNGKNLDVIDHMMEKVRVDKEHFEKSLQRFQATRSIFSQQTNLLYSHLNLKAIDKLIAETKRDMEISLTTSGLKARMQTFFRQMHGIMEDAARQAQEIKELMEGVYRKFQEEHGLSNIKPHGFSVMKYLREIKRIEDKHMQFFGGMSLLVTEQKSVTRRFYESAVARIRAIFATANRDADNWLRTIMSPMESQVREHQIQLRRRLESIKRIHKASDTLEDRLNELKDVRDGIRAQDGALKAQADTIVRILSASAGSKSDTDPAPDINLSA
ncbi:MAG: dynamin family protein [Gammaproteobacteria bacterium]|nr:dynamin family protein [Gammaproteobacteria bacterium]